MTAAQQTAPAATGSCAGGFAGIATTGWVTNLSAGETTSNGLLDDVGDLLTDLLSQNPGQAQMLLSLAGVAPSAVMGCTLNPDGGKTVAVQGVDFVGGMLGKGDGAYLTPSSAENLAELSPLAELLEQETVASKACSLRGLTAVTASGDYAGGLAGSLGGGQRGRLAE